MGLGLEFQVRSKIRSKPHFKLSLRKFYFNQSSSYCHTQSDQFDSGNTLKKKKIMMVQCRTLNLAIWVFSLSISFIYFLFIFYFFVWRLAIWISNVWFIDGFIMICLENRQDLDGIYVSVLCCSVAWILRFLFWSSLHATPHEIPKFL